MIWDKYWLLLIVGFCLRSPFKAQVKVVSLIKKYRILSLKFVFSCQLSSLVLPSFCITYLYVYIGIVALNLYHTLCISSISFDSHNLGTSRNDNQTNNHHKSQRGLFSPSRRAGLPKTFDIRYGESPELECREEAIVVCCVDV